MAFQTGLLKKQRCYGLAQIANNRKLTFTNLNQCNYRRGSYKNIIGHMSSIAQGGEFVAENANNTLLLNHFKATKLSWAEMLMPKFETLRYIRNSPVRLAFSDINHIVDTVVQHFVWMSTCNFAPQR